MPKVLTFKREDRQGREPVGPVFIIDPENPPQVGETVEGAEYGWLTRTEAKELARSLGYDFEED